jgi:threonylcarbamoyladenosine tRNA methylthiotransferase CDKAL1
MTGHVYAEGYGCPSNDYDLEMILSRFEAAGYVRVSEATEADVIIVNTCAVKSRTEARVLSRLKLFEEMGKKVVVSGCLPLVDLDAVVKVIPSYTALLSPSSVERIDEVLKHGCDLRGMNLIAGLRESKVGTVTPKMGSVIEVIPISEGCLGTCTFCCTRLARGRLLSFSPDHIVEAIKFGLMRGVREFWLSGQDVGSYGKDIDYDLISLLHSISSIDGDFRIRLGMVNPQWFVEGPQELVRVFRDARIFKFLHLPIQSGNNEVLRTMRRKYTVGDFLGVVDAFRKEYQDFTFWTDIICGYPTEDEEAFHDTLSIIKKIRFDVVNISKFSARPGTPAQKLKPLPSEVVKERSRIASLLWKSVSLSRNNDWIGWRGSVLVDEFGKDETWIGRTDSYKPVCFRDPRNLFGQRVDVIVVDSRSTYLLGKPVALDNFSNE